MQHLSPFLQLNARRQEKVLVITKEEPQGAPPPLDFTPPIPRHQENPLDKLTSIHHITHSKPCKLTILTTHLAFNQAKHPLSVSRIQKFGVGRRNKGSGKTPESEREKKEKKIPIPPRLAIA